MAFLNRRARYHRWATTQLAEEQTPVWTCEAVISEACFLLRGTRGGSSAVLDLLERGAVRIAFRLDEHIAHVAQLMTRYASVPMALADACLVCLAEQHSDSRVLTLDHDFTVYRRHGRLTVPTLMPDRRA